MQQPWPTTASVKPERDEERPAKTALRPRASSSRQRDSYLGRVVASRYRLEERLGEGGMGVVYRARHVLIDRVVALKLIRPDLKKETHLRAWMLREARAANRVDHAHIVEIHDVGETDEGELYLVMEYLVGVSLSSQINKGPMEVARAVDILEQMGAALARAHDLGVVHRDLKSDNIMLTPRGGRHDFVKILDFGLAALTQDPRLAPKGAVFGTPEYMSPEQARGEDATASSDLYALGILFFEMLTGRLPFRSRSRETLLEMQRSTPAPALRALKTDIPVKAEAIALKLLEKEPSKRFRDGHHLQEELKALQRSLPSTPWDLRGSDAPSPPPPPPAPSRGVVEWGAHAANLWRLMTRAYPEESVPAEIREDATLAWNLAAKASQLEGELASQSRKLQGIERRGRALRAEIGRKVEELAQEESRAMRDAQSSRDQAAALRQRRDRYHQHWTVCQRDAEVIVKQRNVNLHEMREVFEAMGSASARVETLAEIIDDHIQRATARETQAEDLRSQINDLRQQLADYSELLENELAMGRKRIAERVHAGLDYETRFHESSQRLMAHFRGKSNCRELLDQLASSHEMADFYKSDQRGTNGN